MSGVHDGGQSGRATPQLASNGRTPRMRTVGWALGGLLMSCEPSEPETVDAVEPARDAVRDPQGPLSEVDKIRALVDEVRQSDLQFVQSGDKHDGPAAAKELEHRLARTPAGVPTASQFIDRIGAGLPRARTPDLVRLADGTMLPMQDWLLLRLAKLEGGTKRTAANGVNARHGSTPVAAGTPRASELSILDALTIVERSDLVFVAPPRKTPKGKLKGKRKEYTGTEFSEMLRKKWELLGKDIRDLDTFVEEIASDAFVSMSPYLVAFRDGHEEEFRPWLLDQLEARKQALASGGVK